MIDRESDIRPIGYGAMLMEGLVGIVSLIAAAAMYPGDYFAGSTSAATFANLGYPIVNLRNWKPRSAKASRGGRAAPYRSPWASRKCSPASPACAG